MSALTDAVEKLLDSNDSHTKDLYHSWDKGDCSEAGLVKILLIQTLREHVAMNGEYADVDQVKLLKLLEP